MELYRTPGLQRKYDEAKYKVKQRKLHPDKHRMEMDRMREYFDRRERRRLPLYQALEKEKEQRTYRDTLRGKMRRTPAPRL